MLLNFCTILVASLVAACFTGEVFPISVVISLVLGGWIAYRIHTQNLKGVKIQVLLLLPAVFFVGPFLLLGVKWGTLSAVTQAEIVYIFFLLGVLVVEFWNFLNKKMNKI